MVVTTANGIKLPPIHCFFSSTLLYNSYSYFRIKQLKVRINIEPELFFSRFKCCRDLKNPQAALKIERRVEVRVWVEWDL